MVLGELALLLAVYHRSDQVEEQQLLLARLYPDWTGTADESGRAIEALRDAGIPAVSLQALVDARDHLLLAPGADVTADQAAMVVAAERLGESLDRRHRWIDNQALVTYVILLVGASAGWFAWFRRVLRRHRELQQRLSEEEARVASDERLTVLVKNSTDLTLILDADLTATFVSPASEHVLGHSPDEIIGRGVLGYVDEDDVPRLIQLVAGLRHEDDEDIQFQMTHADGRTLTMEGVLTNMLSHPQVSGFVLTARDVTERHVIEQQLIHQAFHDGLTGLANRELFADRLGQALAPRRDEADPVVVLFCDLDDFKEVNDRLGHAAGDEVLTTVGERLDAIVRSVDTAARLGGDEFAVLMIDATQEDGELMADRIRARLAAPIEVAGATLQLRVSVGVALAEAGGIDAEEALRNADFAMQWAKGLGKARAEVYNANLHAKALDRLELRSDLQRGLRGEELVLHYQPTMCLQEGTVAGFEALVRWQHPTRGLLLPAEFIPLAEETGLIVPLGSWVLREACRFAVTLPHRGQDLSMSVNVATQQLYQDGFVDEVRDVLRETGLRPNRLVLEITETALLSELDQVKPRLAALRRIGVRLAIDDFGTGYSSLAYLAELALDVLKVDKSFIDRARGGRARPVDHAGDPHHEPRAPPRDGRRGRGGLRTGGLADPGALHDGAGLPVEQAGRRRGRAPVARVPAGSTSRGVGRHRSGPAGPALRPPGHPRLTPTRQVWCPEPPGFDGAPNRQVWCSEPPGLAGVPGSTGCRDAAAVPRWRTAHTHPHPQEAP